MTAKFLKLTKEGQPLQRLFGPNARTVYEKEWKPYGWVVVGETVVAADVAPEEPEADVEPKKPNIKTAKVPM